MGVRNRYTRENETDKQTETQTETQNRQRTGADTNTGTDTETQETGSQSESLTHPSPLCLLLLVALQRSKDDFIGANYIPLPWAEIHASGDQDCLVKGEGVRGLPMYDKDGLFAGVVDVHCHIYTNMVQAKVNSSAVQFSREREREVVGNTNSRYYFQPIEGYRE